jgi:protein O-mannosyl-transferase
MGKRKRLREAPRPTVRRREWLPATVLAALAILVYANSLSNGFVSDDKYQLLKNPVVTSLSEIPRIFGTGVWSFLQIPGNPGNYYRPLQFLVYLMLYQSFGFSAPAFHLLMVLLHATNTVMLYWLVRRLTAGRQVALAAGALFAVHPIHTEVVDWIAAVPDVMVTTLVLAGVWWLARQEEASGGLAIAGHCGLYLAVLLTKETGAMLLPLYAGYGFLLRGHRWQELRRNAKLYSAMLVTFGAYLAMRRAALGSLAPGQGTFFHLGPLQFALSGVVLAGQYVGALFLPANLNYFHIFHPAAGFTLGLLIAGVVLGAIAFAFFRFRQPLVAFGIFWIAATLAPAFNLTGVGQNIFAERYLYLPSAGFCWIAGWVWDRLTSYKRGWAMAAGAAVLVSFGAEAVARNRDWRDDYTLFQVTLRQSPTSGWLHNWMAGAYIDRNQFREALAEERLAVQYEPGAPAFHENLGNILLITDPRAAIAEFRGLLARYPDWGRCHSDLGIALEAVGQYREAAAEFQTALRLQPDYAEAQAGYQRMMARLQSN